MRIAIYPGTFDPITFGHIDLILKGLKVVDKIIVAISDVANNDHLFSVDERKSLVRNALYKDLKIKKEKVEIISFNSLTTTLCKKHKANLLLRGLRAVSDFEYEFQLAGMNKKLNREIETIFLMANIENQVISSSLVKEIAQLGGDMTKFITKSTAGVLKKKLK
jgi:pantetheine-phosphate adenylyltransferase